MKSLITASANTQFDDLLDEVCTAVQLTKTQYNAAVDHYHAVGNFLNEDRIIREFNPFIFPQGSMSQQTTVRPIRYVEFDIDLVLRLNVSHSIDPGRVYDLVAQCLRANRLYRDRLECKPRCLRLSYANEFHLDIVPAIPDLQRGGTFLYIPDRERREWRSTNPQGYVAWFEKECAKRLTIFAEKRVEPVPAHLPADQRPTLKRVTQLLKRHRDVIYKDDKDAPPSVVLSTMSAHNYDGTLDTTDALRGVLPGIQSDLSVPGPFLIINPSNPTENLVEGWPIQRRDKFADFVATFRSKIDWLLQQQGLDRITSGLEALFGTEIAARAVKAYAQRIEDQRRAGKLRVGILGGGLTTATPRTVPIMRNENFGE